jgi:hypothetical protein
MNEDVEKVRKLMEKLMAPSKQNKIRESMELAGLEYLSPIVCNETRWDTKYDMLKRFLEIRSYIDKNDRDLEPFLLSTAEECRVMFYRTILSYQLE